MINCHKLPFIEYLYNKDKHYLNWHETLTCAYNMGAIRKKKTCRFGLWDSVYARILSRLSNLDTAPRQLEIQCGSRFGHDIPISGKVLVLWNFSKYGDRKFLKFYFVSQNRSPSTCSFFLFNSYSYIQRSLLTLWKFYNFLF